MLGALTPLTGVLMSPVLTFSSVQEICTAHSSLGTCFLSFLTDESCLVPPSNMSSSLMTPL